MSGAEDVIPAVLQKGLKLQQKTAGQQVSESPIAVTPLHLTTYKLLWAAHVEHSVHTQVLHQSLDTICLRVCVVLSEVEPVIICDVVFENVLDGLEHVPDEPLVTVGDYRHAVGRLAASGPGEEDDIVQMMADGAVDGHTQSVNSIFGGQYSHKKTLSDPKLCTDVFCPVGTDNIR